MSSKKSPNFSANISQQLSATMSTNKSQNVSPNMSSNLSSNTSAKIAQDPFPNIFPAAPPSTGLKATPKLAFRSMSRMHHRYRHKGIYRDAKDMFHSASITAGTFPPMEWREPRSLCSSGNEKVADPKSQLCTEQPTKNSQPQDQRKYKRSLTAISFRKANRKNKRTQRRREYRMLRKCYAVQATQPSCYLVAQECSSKPTITRPCPNSEEDNEAKATINGYNTKIASLNLERGDNARLWQAEKLYT